MDDMYLERSQLYLTVTVAVKVGSSVPHILYVKGESTDQVG